MDKFLENILKNILRFAGGSILNGLVFLTLFLPHFLHGGAGLFMPILVAVVGSFAFPWYFIKRPKMPKLVSRVDLLTGIASLSFLWGMLSTTNGHPGTITTLFLMATTFGLPALMHHFTSGISEKIKTKEELAQKREEEKNPPKENYLDTYQSFLKKLQYDKELYSKVQEILSIVLTIDKSNATLSLEESHEIDRLLSRDMKSLLENYVDLKEESKTDTRVSVLENLNDMTHFLEAVVDRLDRERKHNVNVSNEINRERYKKR